MEGEVITPAAPTSDQVDFFDLKTDPAPVSAGGNGPDEEADEDAADETEDSPKKEVETHKAPKEEEPAEPEDDDDAEPEQKTQADSKQEAKPGRRKSIVVDTGKEQVKISPAATIAVTVAGKEQKVALSELTESYASKTENLKRYKEIELTKRQLQEQQKADNDFMEDFTKKASDPTQAMTVLGELIEKHGGEPLNVIRNIRTVIVDSVAEMLGASPEQKQNLKAHIKYLENIEEANYYREKHEKTVKEKNTLAKRSEVVQRVREVIKKFGLPDEETFGETFEALRELKAQNKLKTDDIYPEDVGGYFTVKSIVEAEFPELLKEPDTLLKLYRISREINPTKDELRKNIRTWLGTGSTATEATNGQSKALSPKPRIEKRTGAKPNNLADLFL